MAQKKDQQKALFPLPAYTYMVRIGTDSYGFSKVSGLSFQYDTMTYRHGLSVMEGANHMIGMIQPINITLERGVVRQGSILLEWISQVNVSILAKQDVTVDLCDEEGSPVISWLVQNAIPTAYEAGTFDATTSDVAIESLSLMANGMRITYHDTDQKGGTRGSGVFFSGF